MEYIHPTNSQNGTDCQLLLLGHLKSVDNYDRDAGCEEVRRDTDSCALVSTALDDVSYEGDLPDTALRRLFTSGMFMQVASTVLSQ